MSFAFFKRAVKICGIFTALLYSVSLSASTKSGKLAIVIDDLGYQPREDAAVLAMPKEVAVAVIPSAPYAARINQQAFEQNRDILIHLPMQPLSGQKIEEGGLYLGMSQQEVGSRVQQAQNIVSHAIGLNNHMGSAATSDARLMDYLMKELHSRQLYFLDSRTVGRSVAYQTAKRRGIGALERHIFLDDSDAYEDVQAQFQKALQYARKQGTAIVIGHPRRNTIAVLQHGLQNLPQDICLVGIGSLWRAEKLPPPFIYIFSDKPATTSIPPFHTVPLLRGVPK